MTDRQIDNLIKPATIADTDPASAHNTAALPPTGCPISSPLQAACQYGASQVSAKPAPSYPLPHEPENGVVLCCQASDRYPAPSADPAETVVRFPDGTHIRYNHNSGAMELKAVTSLTIDTPQTTITGHLTVNQTTTAQGLLTYQNGMNGKGGSLSEHTHPDDSGGTTEKPQ